MKKIGIFGSGKIGYAILCLLQNKKEYTVVVIDQIISESIKKMSVEKIELNVTDNKKLGAIFSNQQFDAVISSLPFFCNVEIAKKAKEYAAHYFDLTEDVKTTEAIAKIAKDADTAFVPQCGLAPGFINIVALNLMHSFDELESVRLYCGALPQETSNAFRYGLTWSTEGLINEYINPCQTILEGKFTTEKAMGGLETVVLDGVDYEAFYTSGGLGSMWNDAIGKVNTMYYKTLRYPGHHEKMKFLLNECNFSLDRNKLKSLLEKNIPFIDQDVVVLYVAVTGYKKKQLIEKNFYKKYYPISIDQHQFTAIQISTASEVCAVVDIVLTAEKPKTGYIQHKDILLPSIINNRFGRYYA